MRYIAPVAELVALDAVNVILASECDADGTFCENDVPCANDEWA